MRPVALYTCHSTATGEIRELYGLLAHNRTVRPSPFKTGGLAAPFSVNRRNERQLTNDEEVGGHRDPHT